MPEENNNLNLGQILGQTGENAGSNMGQADNQLGTAETDGAPQKINDLGTEEVAGGFAFGDWDAKSDLLYGIAGVTHYYGTFSKDKYKYRGYEINYKQAKEIKSITQYMRDSHPGADDWEICKLVRNEWDRRYPDFINRN